MDRHQVWEAARIHEWAVRVGDLLHVSGYTSARRQEEVTGWICYGRVKANFDNATDRKRREKQYGQVKKQANVFTLRCAKAIDFKILMFWHYLYIALYVIKNFFVLTKWSLKFFVFKFSIIELKKKKDKISIRFFQTTLNQESIWVRIFQNLYQQFSDLSNADEI